MPTPADDTPQAAQSETAAAMTAVAQAVTGPNSPDAATVSAKPDERLVWALVLAGPAISLMIASLVVVIADPWRWIGWPSPTAEGRVHALAAVALALCVNLTFVTFR